MRELGAIRSLTMIDVGHTQITDDGLKGLQGLKKLVDLRVAGTAITDEGVRMLTESLPNLRIFR